MSVWFRGFHECAGLYVPASRLRAPTVRYACEFIQYQNALAAIKLHMVCHSRCSYAESGGTSCFRGQDNEGNYSGTKHQVELIRADEEFPPAV